LRNKLDGFAIPQKKFNVAKHKIERDMMKARLAKGLQDLNIDQEDNSAAPDNAAFIEVGSQVTRRRNSASEQGPEASIFFQIDEDENTKVNPLAIINEEPPAANSDALASTDERLEKLIAETEEEAKDLDFTEVSSKVSGDGKRKKKKLQDNSGTDVVDFSELTSEALGDGKRKKKKLQDSNSGPDEVDFSELSSELEHPAPIARTTRRRPVSQEPTDEVDFSELSSELEHPAPIARTTRRRPVSQESTVEEDAMRLKNVLHSADKIMTQVEEYVRAKIPRSNKAAKVSFLDIGSDIADQNDFQSELRSDNLPSIESLRQKLSDDEPQF
jgi:hypothetical protein